MQKWTDWVHTSLDILLYSPHLWAAFDEEQFSQEKLDLPCFICHWEVSENADLSVDGLLIT